MAQIYRVVCRHQDNPPEETFHYGTLTEVRRQVCRPRLRVGDVVRVWEIGTVLSQRYRDGFANWLSNGSIVVDWDRVIATRAGPEIGFWCREVEAELGLWRQQRHAPRIEWVYEQGVAP